MSFSRKSLHFQNEMMRGAMTSVGLRSAASLAVSASSKRANTRSILFCPRDNEGAMMFASSEKRSSSSSSLRTKNASGFSPSASSSSSSSPRRRFARASDFAHHQTSSSFSSTSFPSSFCNHHRRGSLSVRKSNTNEASKDAQIWIDSWKTAGGGGGSSGGGFGGGGGGGAVILEEEEETLKVCGRCICCFWNRTRWRRNVDLSSAHGVQRPRASSCSKTTKASWKRTLTFTFLGAFLVGPALHFWYRTWGRL